MESGAPDGVDQADMCNSLFRQIHKYTYVLRTDYGVLAGGDEADVQTNTLMFRQIQI